MTTNTNPIAVKYSDSKLRILVEEYITQQKSEFTLKGVCSYILYWAVEDGKIVEGKKLIESDELQQDDKDRIRRILEAIKVDGRINQATEEIYRKS